MVESSALQLSLSQGREEKAATFDWRARPRVSEARRVRNFHDLTSPHML